MQRFKGLVCVVTGAARGIGLAIAKRFAQEGGAVVVTDIDIEAGAAAAQMLGARFIKLDVSKEDDWRYLSECVPSANVVVNNAGVTGLEEGDAPHDPEFSSLQDWRHVHSVNLDGVFLGCRYALGAFRANDTAPVTGSIVNISSRSGMVGVPAAAAYASSKAAIRNHTKTVALYAAQNGWRVRCNSVHPAAILTPIWEPVLGRGAEREARMEAFVADTPLKRFGEPEEVAAVVATLASDEAGYMTGAEITIDGGLLAGSAVRPG